MPNWFDDMDMLDAARIQSTVFMVRKNAELQLNSGILNLETGVMETGEETSEDHTPEHCRGEDGSTLSHGDPGGFTIQPNMQYRAYLEFGGPEGRVVRLEPIETDIQGEECEFIVDEGSMVRDFWRESQSSEGYCIF